MKVGFVQTRPLFGKKEKNVEKLGKLLKRAWRREAELLVLPELFNTGYVFRKKSEVAKLAEKIPDGKTTRALERVSREFGTSVVAGVCEAYEGRHYNSAVLVSPKKGFVSVYRKAHLFDSEKRWFSPGNTGFSVQDLGAARVGTMICFDWFFPEAARVLALKGADIICHPANLVLPYCQTAILGAALQNRVFVITANRTGTERGTKFTGRSQITGPGMEVLARGSAGGEGVKVVDIDPERARDKRIPGRNNDAFVDRRVGLYGRLLSKNV